MIHLDYSRIEFAADARHRVCGCGSSLQIPCNEANAVKSQLKIEKAYWEDKKIAYC